MSTTDLDVFDTTVHKTNAWLNELMEELGSDGRHTAYLALRATRPCASAVEKTLPPVAPLLEDKWA